MASQPEFSELTILRNSFGTLSGDENGSASYSVSTER